MKYLTILAILAYFIIVALAYTASSQSFGVALYSSSVTIILLSYYWALVPAILVKKHLNYRLYLTQIQKSFVVGIISLVGIFGVELIKSLLGEYSYSPISSGSLRIALGVLSIILIVLMGFFVTSFVITLLAGSAALQFYEKSATGKSGNSIVTFLSYFYLLFGVVYISKRIDRAKQAILN